jgi:hypothetical protein
VKTARIAVLLALALMLLAAVPVSAAPPVVVTEEAEINYPLTHQPCPGFQVWDHEFYTLVTTSYYDGEGVLRRQNLHASGIDNFYNPDNPDRVLSGRFFANGKYDERTGEWYIVGVPFHITVPGYGTVLVRAGRWSGFEEDHLAGKDSFLSPKDMEQFCSYLAGN